MIKIQLVFRGLLSNIRIRLKGITPKADRPLSVKTAH